MIRLTSEWVKKEWKRQGRGAAKLGDLIREVETHLIIIKPDYVGFEDIKTVMFRKHLKEELMRVSGKMKLLDRMMKLE